MANIKNTQLIVTNKIPDGFLDCESDQLHEYFSSLSLLHLKGKNPEALFVSVMLHGNENAGLYAIQKLLKKYNHGLPRSLIISFGNTEAAKYRMRRLDHQPDYNRIWKSNADPSTNSEEQTLAQNVLNYLEKQNLFACIDIHNNTGKNPMFVCINQRTDELRCLAKTFDGPIVYFDDPSEVLAIACLKLAPSVTIECGLPDQEKGADKAFQFVDDIINKDTLTASNDSLELFEIRAKVTLPVENKFSFSKGENDFWINPEIESFNFLEASEPLLIGSVENNAQLIVEDGSGNDHSQEFLQYRDGQILTKKNAVMSMLTLNEKVIRQDCLGYFMTKAKF